MRRPRTVLLFFCVAALVACDRPITIMTYNVYNLFDAVDNGTEYRRYDPELGRWTEELFLRKLSAVAETIRKSHPSGPDIVALQEIENRNALDQLCERHLSGYAYRVFVPSAEGALQCALISRLPIVRVGTLNPGRWNDQQLRSVLEVEIDCGGSILHIFNVHWKSKTDGVRDTEEARLAASRVTAARIRTLLEEDPAKEILVLGDFNENVEEQREAGGRYPTALMPAGQSTGGGPDSLYLAEDPGVLGLWGRRVVLYDGWFELPRELRGSYVYNRSWQTLDHILLAPGLFDETGLVYRRGSFRPVRHAFMLHPESGFPLRDRELDWRYSDHLPLLIELTAARER